MAMTVIPDILPFVFDKKQLYKILNHLQLIRDLAVNLKRQNCRAPNVKKWCTISELEMEGIKRFDPEFFRLLMRAEIAMQNVLDHVKRKNDARKVRR